MNFVFTGILEGLTRNKAEQMVRLTGHEVSDTVRPSTSYVVVGIRPGSKLIRAKTLGVKVISEEGFKNLIEKLKVPVLPDTIPGVYFMIGEISWQYNDEYYYREGSAVDPTKLFRSRTKALHEMARLEQEAFKKHFGGQYPSDIMEYCAEGKGVDSMFKDYYGFREYMKQFGIELQAEPDSIEYGDDIVAACTKMLCKMGVEQFGEARRYMKFGFFEMHEVKLGD